ncbi:hypothetical protein [Antiquaquibacter soli]|uniref:Uncharacterized protein n=1 Tax=Antiquaquibacter soli TaxID=3064523 RepID=A0ABT9BKV6_9MICO|nr:hypothetical protein [Protaetiibacter sp. WY-16]MDO7881657.1 hypothetical protein [Protaetiibacter sp. WY-16]
MSAATATVALGPAGQLRVTALQVWRELPRVLAVGAVTAATAVPVGVALLGAAPPWLVALALTPLALASAGLAQVGAALADGGRVRVGDLLRADALLALLILAAAAGSGWLVSQDGVLRIVGFAAAGLALAVLPRALAYGAVRGRGGIAAIRGGAILAVYRPGTTVSLIALGVLGAFAVAATVGTLALVVPALLAAFAARVTADELAGIDAAQGARP